MLKATQLVKILEKMEFESAGTKDFDKIQSLTNIFVKMFSSLETQMNKESNQIKANKE